MKKVSSYPQVHQNYVWNEFVSQYVVRHNAEKHQAKYLLAAETVLEST